ncbi:deaminase [Ktedonobacteria bacterium brp13]|nr:deaminase [Ktedonobacteria bacterium brp13]
MGQITTGFSMSLDGYVAGPDDDVSLVFKWMTSGDTNLTASKGDGDIELKVSEKSVEVFEEAIEQIGALVAGRRLFEMTHGWGGKHPVNAPVVVVTHRPAPEWVKADWPVTFANSIESAIEQAKAIAGDKKVAIASTTILHQCLRAGLVDEIHVDLVPYLLGAGVRMFDTLDAPIELKSTSIIPSTGVTHLTFRIVK